MLLGDLYYIITQSQEGTSLLARLELNNGHEIFLGHFPGRPVLPGVCQIQMLEEILSGSLNRPLKIKYASQVKFLSVIDPGIHQQIDVVIKTGIKENGVVLVEASYIWGKTVFLKMKGEFDEYRSA